MKRLFLIITMSIVALLSGSSIMAQIDWINFDRVKVKVQNGYTGSLPSDSNFDDNRFHEDEMWQITLGKELRNGVYEILDEDGYRTGNIIYLDRSGLSGLWGWLTLEYTNAQSPYKEHHQQGRGYFHTRHYSLMLNPYR